MHTGRWIMNKQKRLSFHYVCTHMYNSYIYMSTAIDGEQRVDEVLLVAESFLCGYQECVSAKGYCVNGTWINMYEY
jgi:hypothetical protein